MASIPSGETAPALKHTLEYSPSAPVCSANAGTMPASGTSLSPTAAASCDLAPPASDCAVPSDAASDPQASTQVANHAQAPILRARARPRKENSSNHVTWDEEAIAEHDKERGSRQKIEEPDTPFIRSPHDESPCDSPDEGVASSSGPSGLTQRRLSFREPVEITSLPGYEDFAKDSGNWGPPAENLDVNPGMVADRLRALCLTGLENRSRSVSGSSDGGEQSKVSSTCSSRSSSSARHLGALSQAAGQRHSDKHISIEDEGLQPKPTSDKFKAKRAQHYNEMAAIKAFKQQQRKPGNEISSESNGSDEEDEAQMHQIRTNTNTNINTTASQADVRRARRRRTTSSQASETASDGGLSSDGGSALGRQAPSVAAKAASSSSEVLVSAPTVAAQAPTAATKAASSSSGSRISIKEEVQPKSPSDAFKAKRANHYNEAAAMKAFRQRKRADETSSESERSDDSEAQSKTPPASKVKSAASDSRVANKDSPAGGAAVQIGCQPFKPSPRTPTVEVVSPQPTSPASSRPTAQTEAAWKNKRNAHYSEMAAAMRAAPPPSDEEDSEDEA